MTRPGIKPSLPALAARAQLTVIPRPLLELALKSVLRNCNVCLAVLTAVCRNRFAKISMSWHGPFR